MLFSGVAYLALRGMVYLSGGLFGQLEYGEGVVFQLQRWYTYRCGLVSCLDISRVVFKSNGLQSCGLLVRKGSWSYFMQNVCKISFISGHQ